MEKFIIQGKNKISGEIDVKGAKNAALKAIPASILSSEKITLTNLPDIEDIKRSLEMMKHLGAEINMAGNKCELQLKELKTIELSQKSLTNFEPQ